MLVRAARLAFVVLLGLCLEACAAAVRSNPTPWSSGPVDFFYRLDGVPGQISDLRGRPLVVVLVRVSELTSELYLREVVEAYGRCAGEVRFLVLSLEPTEEPLLAPFVEFQRLPFPVGVAAPEVAAGVSPLGPVPLVPTTYLLDRGGRVSDAAAGAVTAGELTDAVRRLGGGSHP